MTGLSPVKERTSDVFIVPPKRIMKQHTYTEGV